MNLFIVLGIVFFITFILGFFLEKVRVPWVFASLLLGLVCSVFNPFPAVTQSESFLTFSEIGLYLLLFLIGFELNIKEIKNQGSFIIKTTFFIELLEVILIGTFIHFVFDTSWLVAILVSLSFATVGEAVLLPILDEFKLTKTKLGQIILGVATFDDIFEIFVLFVVILIAPILLKQTFSVSLETNYLITSVAILLGLSLLFLFIRTLQKEVSFMNVPNVAAILPLVFAVLFVFIGIGSWTEIDLSILGALTAGLAVKNLLPEDRLEEVEPQIKFITYGLFAPIFFLSVGLETNVNYVFNNIFLIVILILLGKFAKVFGSFLVGRKTLGTYPSLFMGVALGVRFSTSIVIIKILFDNGLIDSHLFSVLIGTSIVFKFIIPFILSYLVKRWQISEESEPTHRYLYSKA